ncbi:unnamed protein product [Camellia sinensis]
MKARGCVKYNHTSCSRSFASRASTLATMVSKIAKQSQPSVTHPLSEKQISREVLGKRSVYLKGYGIRKDSTSSSTHFEAPNSEDASGYDTLSTRAVVEALLVNGKTVLQVSEGSEVEVFLNRTPFYAESDVKKSVGNIFVHKGTIKEGSIVVGGEVEAVVDAKLRQRAKVHHTAIHLLQAALKKVIGQETSQAGSLVAFDCLRFDFNFHRSLPLLLLAVEDGIFNDSWRIRQSSVELLGDLLFKVVGTSGKALLEGGSDDEGASTEAQGRAIIEVLGREKRNKVLAALYMIRTDVSLTVRQAALHVWKAIAANTPKTLKEIMPVLMNTLITSLASSASERRQVVGRSVGELVRKLGERVLPLIIPILSRGLKDPNASRRQGVCIDLSEVMASASKSQLLSFMDELIPTIRTALCDSMPKVRDSAGLAFSTLHKSAGLQAIDEIVPTLLHALEDDETSDIALNGLKQILKPFNAHALGALAEVAGPGFLDFHHSLVVPALLTAMDDGNTEVQNLAKKAAETVVLVIDEEGIEPLISELLKGVGDHQASIRQSSSYLLGYFFKNSKLYLVDEAPNVITTPIVLLSDSDSATVAVAWEALSRVVGLVPKEVLPSYIKLVRDAVSTSRDKERRKRKGGPVLIPGLCLPKALQPLLPIFLQGLISGSAELREQAAQGLGELIKVTSEQALKEFVISITRPLIQIIGDRFPWQAKSAILSTLSIMIRKGGMALKPFSPQLQTTFIKCLQDNTSGMEKLNEVVLRESGFDVLLHYWSDIVLGLGVKRSKGYAFIQYTSQEDALLALESMDHKGQLKNGNIAAIKVLSPESSQGVKEFLTEIRVISDIEHQNLVKLYGCCVDEDHRILVYNYLENNSFAQTLIGLGSNNTGI